MRDRNRSESVVLYGIHPIWETIKAGKRTVRRIFLARDASVHRGLSEVLNAVSCPIRTVSPDELTRICGSQNHQGIAAEVGPYLYVDLDDILRSMQTSRSCLLVLDEIQDPFNLGSIIRSAECLGAFALVLTKNNSCSVTAAVEKTSAGATAHIPIARVVNLVRAIQEIKDAGFWVYGMDSRATQDLYSLKLSHRTAFVVGGEGTGLRRLVRERCDLVVSVPMRGRIASLNVSHATAIALAEFQKRDLSGREYHEARSLGL